MSPDWFTRIPKVELHVHLEGGIPLPTLLQLIQKYEPDLPIRTVAELENEFRYRDFQHFLSLWSWKNRFIREAEDFELIAEGFARGLADAGVVYAEAFFSPPDFLRRGLAAGTIAAALRRGLDRVPQVRVSLIADLVRNFGPDRALALVDQVAELQELGVIGVGLGGSEVEYPPKLFRAAFARARRVGLHVTAHAGEAAGPESVWGAIHALQVERIGHGVRCVEDPALVEYLAAEGIPLEVCPVSNVLTRVVPRLEDHPVRRLFDRGVVVTVNSDDPVMFATSAARELEVLHGQLGFGPAALRTLIENAVAASWLPAEERDALMRRITSDPAWLE